MASKVEWWESLIFLAISAYIHYYFFLISGDQIYKDVTPEDAKFFYTFEHLTVGVQLLLCYWSPFFWGALIIAALLLRRVNYFLLSFFPVLAIILFHFRGEFRPGELSGQWSLIGYIFSSWIAAASVLSIISIAALLIRSGINGVEK
jgi:hypothetical protein